MFQKVIFITTVIYFKQENYFDFNVLNYKSKSIHFWVKLRAVEMQKMKTEQILKVDLVLKNSDIWSYSSFVVLPHRFSHGCYSFHIMVTHDSIKIISDTNLVSNVSTIRD